MEIQQRQINLHEELIKDLKDKILRLSRTHQKPAPKIQQPVKSEKKREHEYSEIVQKVEK